MISNNVLDFGTGLVPEKRDRSVNYLAVEAIMEYLDREEKKGS